jgi:isoleucyl-tRNA synthetase
MAEARVAAYLNTEQECKEGELLPFDKEKKLCPWRVIERVKGTDLVGLHYQQLMRWVKPCEKIGDLAPKFVNQYADEHPQKVFAANDAATSYVEKGRFQPSV